MKWHSTNPNRLLIAAMHGGFRVVDFKGLNSDCSGDDITVEVKAKFDEHESLGYGVDWSGGIRKGGNGLGEGEDLIASCSFYDHTVHVWSC